MLKWPQSNNPGHNGPYFDNTGQNDPSIKRKIIIWIKYVIIQQFKCNFELFEMFYSY